MLFLATDPFADAAAAGVNADLMSGGLVALIMGMIAVFAIVGLILWIYMSLAFTAIGKKAKLSYPGVAWIPLVGPAIIAFRASGMHWWPWLLLVSVILNLIPFIGPILSIIGMIVFAIYSIIWHWKMFEAVGKPGWWALAIVGSVIPLIGFLFGLAFLILVGIAAWSKE